MATKTWANGRVLVSDGAWVRGLELYFTYLYVANVVIYYVWNGNSLIDRQGQCTEQNL